jgi:hypothetical protein
MNSQLMQVSPTLSAACAACIADCAACMADRITSGKLVPLSVPLLQGVVLAIQVLSLTQRLNRNASTTPYWTLIAVGRGRRFQGVSASHEMIMGLY